MTEVINGAVFVKPDNGFRYVTNGEKVGEIALIGKYDSVENWHSTNQEPVEDIPIL